MGSIRYWLLGAMWLLLAAGMGYWVKTKEVRHVSIAAGRANSETYELATAMVNEYSKHFPDIEFEVYQTASALASGILLEQGKVDFAMVGGNFELGDGLEANNVQSVAKAFTRVSGLLTPPGSDILNYRDLPGKKISVPANDREGLIFLYGLTIYFDIPPSAYTVIPLSDEAADFALEKGEVDAIYRVRGMAADEFRNIFRRLPNANFMSTYIADALNVHYPSIKSVKIPHSTFKGHPAIPPQNTEAAGVDILLAANKSTPKPLVYNLTKALFEHRASLTVNTEYAASIAPIADSENYLVPLHPGARQYYDREKPSLLQQNSRLLGSLIYLLAFVVSGVMALRTHLKRSRRVQMQEYNMEILKALEHAEQSNSLESLAVARSELVGIFKEVVKQLDGDQISQEEFHRFSFTWRAAERTIQRQESSLQRGEQI